MSSAQTLIGSTLLGKLRVVRLLGEGGMGAVYEVEHLLTKHRRALKVLHPEYAKNPDVVARFVREAGVAGTLKTPYVVETFDAGQLEDGSPYVVMEMLDGQALASVLEHNNTLSLPDAARVMALVCRGVQVAHRSSIVHRDLKPENIFVVRDDGEESVKILDFGVSKFSGDQRDRTLTRAGTAMGTPTYMSPEQLQGLPDVDSRSDIYAIGVLMYEALTGKRPFDAENYVALALRVYQGQYTPLHEVLPGIDPSAEAVIAKAMSTNKEDRYATCDELAAELERFARKDSTRLLSAQGFATTDRPPMATLDSATLMKDAPAAAKLTGPIESAPSHGMPLTRVTPPHSNPPSVRSARPQQTGPMDASPWSQSSPNAPASRAPVYVALLGFALFAAGVIAWMFTRDKHVDRAPQASTPPVQQPAQPAQPVLPLAPVPTPTPAPEPPAVAAPVQEAPAVQPAGVRATPLRAPIGLPALAPPPGLRAGAAKPPRRSLILRDPNALPN